MTYLYIDSDDDDEKELVDNITAAGGLARYIVDNVINLDNLTDYKQEPSFRVALGLALHFYIDRLLRHHIDISKEYTEMKEKQLSTTRISEDLPNDFVNESEKFFKKLSITKPIIIKAPLKAADYIQLLNGMFNPDIPLPSNIAYDEPRANILKAMGQDADYREMITKIFIPTSSIMLAPKNSAQVFACNKFVDRQSKNLLKNATIQSQHDPQDNINLAVIYRLCNGAALSLQEQITLRTDSQKEQSDIANQGNYRRIFNILSQVDNPSIIAQRMLQSIKGMQPGEDVINVRIKANSDTVKNSASGEVGDSENSIMGNTRVDKLTQLIFFSETERNKANILANLMLLKRLEQKDKILPAELDDIVGAFPMSMRQATQATRELLNHYKDSLQNSHYIDYGMPDSGSKSRSDGLLALFGDMWSNYDQNLGAIQKSLYLLNPTILAPKFFQLAKDLGGTDNAVAVAKAQDQYDTFINTKQAINTLIEKEIDSKVLTDLIECLQGIRTRCATEPKDEIFYGQVTESTHPIMQSTVDQAIIELRQILNTRESKLKGRGGGCPGGEGNSAASTRSSKASPTLKFDINNIADQDFKFQFQKLKADLWHSTNIVDLMNSKLQNFKNAIMNAICELHEGMLTTYGLSSDLKGIKLRAMAEFIEDHNPDSDHENVDNLRLLDKVSNLKKRPNEIVESSLDSTEKKLHVFPEDQAPQPIKLMGDPSIIDEESF